MPVALVLLLLAAAPEVWVAPGTGRDSQPGTAAAPFATCRAALRHLPAGGTLHLAPSATPYHEPILITRGGTAEQPLVIDGHGAIIDLGTDLSSAPWTQDGAEWVCGRDLGRPPLDDARKPGDWMFAGLFVDGRPYNVRQRRATGPLAPGDLRYDADGRLRFVPLGRAPGAASITLPAPAAVSCVAISGASFVTVRRLTARYAGNDGFNIHGDCRAIRLEQVRALHCADEGISAHESAEVEVEDAEIAFCGSVSGGITDVQQSVSHYTRCLVHHNRVCGFGFEQGRHRLRTCVSFGHPRGDLPKPSATVVLEDCATLAGPAPTGEGGAALWQRAKELADWPADKVYE